MKITDNMIEKSLEMVKNKRDRTRLNKTWDSILLSELKTKKLLRNSRKRIVNDYLSENNAKIIKIVEHRFVLFQEADRDLNLFRLQFLKEIHSAINK